MPQEIVAQFDRKYAAALETNRSVANVTARNNIPSSVRWLGMLVYVQSDQNTYVLRVGITNNDWELLTSTLSVGVIDNLTSTSTASALSANQGRILENSKLASIVAGTNISIDNTDPLNPIISASGGGGGGSVDSVFGRTGIVSAQVGDYSTFYVLKTGDTLTGNLQAPILIGSGSGGNNLRAYGSSTGNSNVAYCSFYESNGTGLQGYVGFASSGNSNLRLLNNISNQYISLLGAGGANALTFYDGTTSRVVWHSGNDGSGSGLDADLLDGISSPSFLRSDVNTTFSSTFLRFNDNSSLRFGNGDDFRLLHDGSTNRIQLVNGDLVFSDGLSTARLTLGRTTGALTATGALSFQNGLILSSTNNLGSNITTLRLIGGSGDNTRSGGFKVESNNGTLSGAMYFLSSNMRIGTVSNHSLILTTNNATRGTFSSAGLAVVGVVTATSTMTATNFILSSDRRKKRDIEPLIPRSLAAPWKTYSFKEAPEDRRVGVIAQDLLKIAPDLVIEQENGDLTIKYIDFLMEKVAYLEEVLYTNGLYL